MSLFNVLSKPDRSRTQLAYMVNYYPEGALHDNTISEFFICHAVRYIPKAQIVAMCNEAKTHLVHNQVLPNTEFKLHWAFNNVPTEIEWNKKAAHYLVRCEFRITPMSGPVCILSFDGVKHQFPQA